MKKFLSKIVLFCIPIIFLILLFIVEDPFKTIRNYDMYVFDKGVPQIQINKGLVSLKMYERNCSNYNAFIFGSSRSMFYEVKEWMKYIGQQNCFHFDASSDNLYGINKKVLYVSKKSKLDYALIVLDYEALSGLKANNGVLFSVPPVLDGSSNIYFQVDAFKGFCSNFYFLRYLAFKYLNIIDFDLFTPGPWKYYKNSNEFYHYAEYLIEKDSAAYYSKSRLSKANFQRNHKMDVYPAVINRDTKIMLQEIKDVFNEHKTQYKIIISPLFNQIRLNPKDITILKEIFGANVYDFSGVNEYTNSYFNYYENSHYRPKVANDILKRIYLE